jgi:uncharacterized protein
VVRPTILIVGDDDAVAPYHPLSPIEPSLRATFGVIGDLRLSRDRERALCDLPASPSLLVLATDRWDDPISDEAMSALERWLAMGGKMLALHQGISLQARAEFVSLVGARFVGHPDASLLRFSVDREHPATAGVPSSWTHVDEPYRFDPDPNTSARVFLTYEDAEGRHPAGWERTHGSGRIAYLAPGHTSDALSHPAYAALVAGTARWLVG